MKILTYNIRNWRDDKAKVWKRRRAPMVEQFTDVNPDIILLQEVCWVENDPNPDNSMILWLSEQMPEYANIRYADNGMAYYNPNFSRYEREGLAVLSKVDIKENRVIELGTGGLDEGGDGNNRICLAVYFDQFNLYNCHLSTDPDGRLNNIKKFNAEIGVDDKGMMNGDLNTTPDDPIFTELAGWTDLWKVGGSGDGFTFGVPTWRKSTFTKPTERIDYFMAGANFLDLFGDIKVTMDEKSCRGFYSSDHLGVVSEFAEQPSP